MYINFLWEIAHAIKEIARSISAVACALDRIADRLPDKEVPGNE